MATALEIIESAMGKLGLFGPGDVVSAEDGDVCLQRLNALVDAWENEGLFAYTTTDTIFTLPANTSSRTIGPSMQINMVRPVKILMGSFCRVDNIDYRLTPIGESEYNNISLKSTQGSVTPSVCFYDGGTPTGIVYFWPISSVSVEVHLITPESGGTATDLTTSYVFPPGYQRALEYNLALEIAHDFDQKPTPMVMGAAANAKRSLKRTNSRVPQLDMEQITSDNRGRSLVDFYSGR
jgi:hypothetical protein